MPSLPGEVVSVNLIDKAGHNGSQRRRVVMGEDGWRRFRPGMMLVNGLEPAPPRRSGARATAVRSELA